MALRDHSRLNMIRLFSLFSGWHDGKAGYDDIRLFFFRLLLLILQLKRITKKVRGLYAAGEIAKCWITITNLCLWFAHYQICKGRKNI